jgi:hypothetical protein
VDFGDGGEVLPIIMTPNIVCSSEGGGRVSTVSGSKYGERGDGGHVPCLRLGQFERSGVDRGVVDQDVDGFGDLFGLLDGLLHDVASGFGQ